MVYFYFLGIATFRNLLIALGGTPPQDWTISAARLAFQQAIRCSPI